MVRIAACLTLAVFFALLSQEPISLGFQIVLLLLSVCCFAAAAAVMLEKAFDVLFDEVMDWGQPDEHRASDEPGYTKLPPSTEPAIEGRVPTPWLIVNAHLLKRHEFYDKSLSEDDLRALVESRNREPA